MKKLITLLTLFLMMVSIQGQQTVLQSPSKDYYLQKSKNQRTAAWVILLSGTAMTVGGLIAFDNSWDEDSNTATDIYGFIALGGVVADLVSIPLFIGSGKNKRKAASVSFNYKNHSPDHKNAILPTSMTYVTLRIAL